MHDLTQTLMERIFSCLQPFRTSLSNCLFVCLMAAMTSSVRSQSERLVSRVLLLRRQNRSDPVSDPGVDAGRRRSGGGAFPSTLTCLLALPSVLGSRGDGNESLSALDPRSRFLILIRILIQLLRIQGDLVLIKILREGRRGQRSMAGNFLSHLSSSLVFLRLSQSSDSCSSVCSAQISHLSITATSVALAPPPAASLVCNLSIKPANYSRPESGGGAARPSEERRRRGGR